MADHDRDRDNVSGRFVSDEFADQHPDTTTSESTQGGGGDQKVYRDNKTGRFVTEKEADADPGDTSVDHV